MNIARASLSPLWHRAANLRPRLKPHVDVVRQVSRGTPWYVAYDATSNRSYRFSPAVYSFVMRLDGDRTVDAIWQMLAEEMDEHAPSQDDILRLLGQLYMSDMLAVEGMVDAEELATRSEKQARKKVLQRVQNPLFIRVPLFDPDRFLNATLGLVKPLMSPLGAIAWLALMVWLVVQVGVHWEALTNDIGARILAVDNLALMLVVFPILKAIHELAHGYSTKLFGGEVHDVGLMFLVFLPVPYVEASASAVFPSKWQRAFVASAGMMAELVVAAGAMLVWINAEPGLVSSLAFNTMVLASLSTLVFNGNPLLRFDAYFILSDLIEVPNLGSRSNKYWAYLAQRYLFGLKTAPNPARDPGERGWFVFYAPAAFIYRLTVLFTIALFVSTSFFIVGVILAIWTIILSLVWPSLKAMAFVVGSDALSGQRGRALLVSGGLAAALGLAFFAVPVPHGTVVTGVVRLPDNAQVTLPTGGDVDRLLVVHDAEVDPGAPLAQLSDPFLDSRKALVDARLEEVRLRVLDAEATAQRNVALYRQQEDFLKAERATIEQQQAFLQPVASHGGRFVQPARADYVGRYAPRGEVIGHILDESEPVVLVAVPQARVDLVRQQMRGVSLRAGSRLLDPPTEASVMREVPGATRTLPSPAFAREAGGPFAVTQSADGGTMALEPVFLFEIAAGGLDVNGRLGERVYARFDHGASPLGPRLARAVRQIFLRQFGV